MELAAKDVATFDQEFMYDYVTFNDGLLLYKNDLVQDAQGVITTTAEGSPNMQLLRTCSFTQIYDVETNKCSQCPEGRVADKPNGSYCLSCGDLYMGNDCDTDPNQHKCHTALLACEDPLNVFRTENLEILELTNADGGRSDPFSFIVEVEQTETGMSHHNLDNGVTIVQQEYTMPKVEQDPNAPDSVTVEADGTVTIEKDGVVTRFDKDGNIIVDNENEQLVVTEPDDGLVDKISNNSFVIIILIVAAIALILIVTLIVVFMCKRSKD